VLRSLDRKLRRSTVIQADLIAWLGRAIDELLRKGHTLTWIARHLNYVSDALNSKIATLYSLAQREAFQTALAIGNEETRPAP
jgi:type III restriction enzyme